APERRQQAEPRADRDRQHAAGARQCAGGDPDLTLQALVSLALHDGMARVLPGGDSALEDARAKAAQPRCGHVGASAGATDERDLAVARQLATPRGYLVEWQRHARLQ